MCALSRSSLSLAIGLLLCTSVVGQDEDKPLSVRFPPGFFRTIRQPSVQQDLKLTEEQRERLDAIDEEHRRIMAALPKGDRQAVRDKNLERYDRVNDAVVQVLEPHQVKRFKQILWQQGGALESSEVREALGVTEEQLTHVRKMLRDHYEELKKNIDPDGDPATLRRLIHESRAAGNEKALAILTPEQREKWRALMGAPFIGAWDEPVPRRRPSGQQ